MTYFSITLERQALLTPLLTQPHRHYHNINHINDSLVELYTYLESVGDPIQARHGIEDSNYTMALVNAIWYHDIIYNPYAPPGVNEEQSARLFKATEDPKHSGSHWPHWAAYAIRCTAHHLKDQLFDDIPWDNEWFIEVAKVMLDIDLAGLGHPYSTYVRNSKHIECEYYRTMQLDFLNARHKFLTKLLERKTLYYTKFFSDRYEERARKNIKLDLEWIDEALELEDTWTYSNHQTVAYDGKFDQYQGLQ